MAANRLGPEVRGNTTRPGPIAPTAADTWFVDCTGGDPTTGTAVEQSWFNRILANLRSVFTQSGMTVANSTGDDNMLRDGVARQTQAGQMSYAADTGTVNAMVIALSPVPLNGYQAGMMCRVLVGNTNTGAVTLNVNALGAKSVVFGGSLRAISPGEFQAGDILNLGYDGTRFQCLTAIQIPHNVANPTLWVRTDGSDAGGTHDGSINDAAHAFLTINAALASATNQFNLTGRTLTIRLGNAGTYAGFVVSNIPNVVVQGDIAAVASYIISGTPQCAVVIGATLTIKGVTFISTGTNHFVQANGGSFLNVQNCAWGNPASPGGSSVALLCASAGSSIIIGGPCSINVSSGYFVLCTSGAVEFASVPITLVGGPGFANSTISAVNNGTVIFDSAASWIGTASGKRYDANLNGVINSGGSGVNFIPGNIAGTTATGGQYA